MSDPNTEQKRGEQLKREFPDVRVIKTWFTCNDDYVCKVCKELHGKTVEIDEFFAPGILHPSACDDCRCWMISRTDILADG